MPANGAGAHEGAAGDGPSAAVDCKSQPPLEPALEESSPTRRSHAQGQPCLKGCHEQGGSAELTFAAAGSAYRAEGERTAALPGSKINGIGGSTLVVDACGNFYAVASALATLASSTQPWLKDPTFRRMEKPLLRVARPGDCNQSRCHDFSGRLNAGIYF